MTYYVRLCNDLSMSERYEKLTTEQKKTQQLRVALYKQAQQILVTAYKDDFNKIYRNLCEEHGLTHYIQKESLVNKYIREAGE